MRGANGMMDLKKWDVGVPGKEKTIWEGGLFKLEVTFPDEYPTKPPKCTSSTETYTFTVRQSVALTQHVQANSSHLCSTPTSTPPAPSVSPSSTKKKAGSPPSQSERSSSASNRFSTSRIQNPLRKPTLSICLRRIDRHTRRRSGTLSRRIPRRRRLRLLAR